LWYTESSSQINDVDAIGTTENIPSGPYSRREFAFMEMFIGLVWRLWPSLQKPASGRPDECRGEPRQRESGARQWAPEQQQKFFYAFHKTLD
jgi:hypothetical protein